NRSQNNTPSAERADGLGPVLASTHLSSLALFHIGHALQIGLNDNTDSALFYIAAARQSNEELNSIHTGSEKDAIIRSMKDNMGGYKRALWPLIQSNDKQALAALYSLYGDYIAFVSPNDGALQKPLTHVKIGYAECLLAMQKPDQAFSVLSGIVNQKM